MFPISEPISNHFLLSLLILLSGLGLVAYLPWHRLRELGLLVDGKALIFQRKQLIAFLKGVLIFLSLFISLSVFTAGLPVNFYWLRYLYLLLAILLSLWASRRQTH